MSPYDIVVFITGIYLVIGALILNTENLQSLFLFRIIPFSLGAIISIKPLVALFG